ncbi:hypothetical protein [Micromonospora sp. NPDC051006]|uniref:hypothetical protein n=1 Tax=Micromonospora sp. NPDC051006 TaxID=3364283 RepID=UPI00378A5268
MTHRVCIADEIRRDRPGRANAPTMSRAGVPTISRTGTLPPGRATEPAAGRTAR